MSEDVDLQALIGYAESLEFYGHRDRILYRLELGDLEAAVIFSDSALDAGRALLQVDRDDQVARHRANLKELQQFRAIVRDMVMRRKRDNRRSVTTEI